MEKIKYFIINSSTVTETTGIESGKEQIVDFIDDENTTEERKTKYGIVHNSLLDESYDLSKFRAHVQAKPTDVLSSIYLSSDGFFISKKAKNIFSNYLIANYQFLTTQIHGHQCENWNYEFLNIAETQIIDYSNSLFFINKRIKSLRTEELDIKIATPINSYEDLINMNRQIRQEKGALFSSYPKKIFLNKKYDLLKLKLNSNILISEKLKNDIEKKELTGFEFIESDIEFYINE